MKIMESSNKKFHTVVSTTSVVSIMSAVSFVSYVSLVSTVFFYPVPVVSCMSTLSLVYHCVYTCVHCV